MRDKRFIAVNRGGTLTTEQHRQLMLWACACLEHAMQVCSVLLLERVSSSLDIGNAWVKGQATVGDARKASIDMLALARELTDPVQIALVRAAGHAVATAHMADHSMIGALYALKAVNCAGKSMDDERDWQNEQLPLEVRDFVLEVMLLKVKSFKMK